MKQTTLTLVATVLNGAIASAIVAQPLVDDPDWALWRSVNATNPWSVHVSGFDGSMFVSLRSSGDDGIHRINFDNSLTKIVAGDRPGGMFVDPMDGDIFYAEDYDGSIFRSAHPGEPRETWVSGFHSSDDDPCGIDVAPPTYSGPFIQPGEALVVDRGSASADGIWAFSLETPENEWEVVPNSSALVDGVDLVISETDVYVADTGGYIWILQGDGTLLELVTSESLAAPAGIVLDPLTGDLIVSDEDDDRVVRVDPVTGDVSPLSATSTACAGGVGISPDGFDIVVADNLADTVYIFTYCDMDYFPGEDCNDNGMRDLCDIANGISEDVNYNNLPDECECVGDLDGDNDVDQGDLGELLAAYNQHDGGDIDGDGDTDQSDLGILLYKYGSVCD